MTHQTDEIRPLEVVAKKKKKTRIDELLGENLDVEQVLAAVEAAAELEINDVGVIVAEDDVLRIDVLDVLLLLLAVLDVAVLVAILGNRMAPKLHAAAGFLTNLELDALFLFVFR